MQKKELPVYKLKPKPKQHVAEEVVVVPARLVPADNRSVVFREVRAVVLQVAEDAPNP
jgi:hypothetical protein